NKIRRVGVLSLPPDSVRFSPEQLSVLPVLSAQGTSRTPLGTLASFQPIETRAELLRKTQQQMIDMTADISGRSLGDIMKDVKPILAAMPPPAGIRVEVAGQYASQQAAFRALLAVLGLAAPRVITR